MRESLFDLIVKKILRYDNIVKSLRSISDIFIEIFIFDPILFFVGKISHDKICTFMLALSRIAEKEITKK